MKISLKWLNDYVDLQGVSVESLQSGLFSCGFEVEEVIKQCNVSKIVTCKILSIDRHPDADKLFVTKVDAGEYGVLQIVTNGTNIKVGDIVPVSLDGAVLSDGTQIKKGKLRGVDSDGMFCGGEEIGISDEIYPGASQNCILVFKDQFPLGKEVVDLLDCKDTIFDISLTANRPDCMSVVGIAREVACLLGREFKAPKIYENTVKGEEISVEVKASDLCPLYYASKVTDVKIQESPEWMKKRLASVGIRAINNIVDITNYVLTEIGQPMHAFDLRYLKGEKIIVRRAENGEKIVTLDEKEFSLNQENLVICDGEKPVALAGIMGGLNSGIAEDTSTIVFESAKFKRDNIRRSSRYLGQRSDSSARFEKGVDSYTTMCGIKRALQLIVELGAGKVSGVVNFVENEQKETKTIETTFEKINNVLGIEVPQDRAVEILNGLNFNCVVNGNNLKVTVPPYREDVEGYPDLAEEIIRFYGYDKIVNTLMDKASVTVGGLTEKQQKLNQVKNCLFNDGYCEIITYSFIGKKDFEAFSLDADKAVKIINPLGEDMSLMRTSLIPSIVNIAVSNINKSNLNGRLYELANVYFKSEEELPIQKNALSMAVFGDKENFFTLKESIEGLFDDLKLPTNREYVPCELSFLHSTRNAKIIVCGKEIGFLGQISPKLAKKLDLNKDLYVAEIDIEELLSTKIKPLKFKAISKFPVSDRDLALEMDKSVTNAQVVDIIRRSGVKALKEIELFDVYEGDKIAQDKKSMAYHLVFASDEKTLSYEEVDGFISKILANLEKNNIKIRG